ncbi:conserved hypothetical protein [Gluconacetobacter diazotrophicus PA1 5]|nr:hypothetical protein [Gluconacetobacter diazotrophicus]ACI49967.1 conserved hypothetical protein [Gluconacetobacter diazotrophicus PA1 5]MBB2156518.1 hypothetical protein [Gluconacetobacter diazotrophicus]TWB06011.1 hypothetical protein FBZ86_11484 [Gluconacetobacter diazotrophicus]
MKMSLGAAFLAVVVVATAPAFAATHHHKGRHGEHHADHKMKMNQKGSNTTEDLNAKSLDAARAGTPTSPAAPMGGTSAMPSPTVPAGTGVTAPPAAPAPSMPNPSNGY